MKIVISGYYGSKNGGDEAMLAAMLEVLREEIPNLHVTVISLNPEYTKRRHNVDAVPRPDIWTIIQRIRTADLLISGGGSLLQNVTSGRSLYYYLAIIFLALLFGRKVMLYAQGIGPIRGALAHKLMNLIVNRVDFARKFFVQPTPFWRLSPCRSISAKKFLRDTRRLTKANLSASPSVTG